jgi:hypothetical protein
VSVWLGVGVAVGVAVGVGVGVGVVVEAGVVVAMNVEAGDGVCVADTVDIEVTAGVISGVAVDVGVGVGTLVWWVNPAKGMMIRANTATRPMTCQISTAFLWFGFIDIASCDCCSYFYVYSACSSTMI